jgi:D-glycero-alpha-D-manno-heptose-7-phosphate kinase
MIVTRTPFRISFLGGGTDLPEFYLEEEGAVLSSTIDKAVYVTVHDRFEPDYRLSYTQTEICGSVEEIKHGIFKSVLKRHAPDLKKGRGLDLFSVADVPHGTGLGSSSSFTVGLIHALRAHLEEGGLKRDFTPEELAVEACKTEIEELREPIGKQDQYVAAFGGMLFIRFDPSGAVKVERLNLSAQMKAKLQNSVMLFYTGISRSASGVLREQRDRIKTIRPELREMKNLAEKLKVTLEQESSVSKVGHLLHEGWKLKRGWASGITSSQVDQWYERALMAGAAGGKIVGAGGGGFLMIVAEPDKHEGIRRELKELKQLPIAFSDQGSRIVFAD